MVDYNKIFAHNRKWSRRKRTLNPGFFKKHFSKQNPDFLYIGCSDSRVSVEKLMGVDIGEVFVHRNIANMVFNDDDNVKAVIQYAVEVLKVEHIVVAGHTGCGGIKASLCEKSQGSMDVWLNKIKDVYVKHQDHLDQIEEEHKRLDEFSRLNALEQCENISNLDCVTKSIKKTGFPKIHAWMYNMSNGRLKDLGF
ncbi:MAG: carbonic anhydrase [Bacteroidales bacterium]|nr:carbonic anhydrase [Bacteroidales bacterium]